MENTLYIALSRQMVIKRQMSVIANNMANGLTPGYKSEQMMFVDHLSKPKGAGRHDRISFVRDIAVMRNMSEGSFSETGNQLDFAIHGKGWFVIQTPEGDRYTRNGHFRLDQEGQLVTTSGNPVLDIDGQPILFEEGDSKIELRGDGTLLANGEERGQIQLAAFENEQALRKVAGNLLRAEAPPIPAEDASVVQGKIEKSNVEPILQTTAMIEAMRSYQGAQRLIDGEHDRLRTAISKLTSDR